MQQSFQSFNDQDITEDGCSSCLSFFSFPKFSIQKEISDDQNFEFSRIETLEDHDSFIESNNNVQHVFCFELDEHIQWFPNDQERDDDIELFCSSFHYIS